MITHIPFNSLGEMRLDWLHARYHFSFANYHNPARMGVGVLRVVNDDIVQPGKGFDFHGHRDMEIITFVRNGAIEHRDNLGNQGITKAGDVQVMSAGTGIMHAEYAATGDVPTTMYQIWLHPNQKGVAPRWETTTFPKISSNALTLLASGAPTGDALKIYQEAAIYGGTLTKGTHYKHSISCLAYVLVSDGALQIGNIQASTGDAVLLRDEPTLTCTAHEETTVVLIDIGNAVAP